MLGTSITRQQPPRGAVVFCHPSARLTSLRPLFNDYSMTRLVYLSLLLLTLSGCNFFAPPAAEQTLAAEHMALGTQVALLRETEVSAADRLLITQEALQTAVRDVEAQGTRIAATVIALGTPFIDTSIITPASQFDPGAGAFAPTPVVVIPGGASQGSLGVGTPTPAPTVAVVAPVNPNAPSLTNIVTTDTVGANDCAVTPLNSFASITQGIYVVAVGNNLTPVNVITYRWQRESIEVWVDTWSPGGNTNGACIWYYLTPNQTALQPGAWAVEVLLDNVPMGAPVPFTINP
jgi:hypothetical protein